MAVKFTEQHGSNIRNNRISSLVDYSGSGRKASNIISSSPRNLFDERISKLSGWWGSRSETLKNEDANYIKRLKVDDAFCSLHIIRHTHFMAWGILWVLAGTMAFTTAMMANNDPLNTSII